MNITDEMIEAVGREVGMAHGGWGEVNPRELMDAIWRVLCAANAKALPEPDEKSIDNT